MKKLSLVTVSLLSVLATAQASAATDTTGFYVGASLNEVDVDADHESESGTGYGVYGGYNFNHWFGLEASLIGTEDLGGKGSDISAGVLSFTPKFTAQINDTFSVYGKVGVASMDVDVENNVRDDDFSGTSFAYGVGVNAAVTERLNIRLSYDVISGDLDGDDDGGDMDTDLKLFGVGVHWQF